MMAPFWLAASMLFLLGSFFYSGTEMGLYRVNRLRLRLQAEHNPTRSVRSLHRLIQHPQETVMALLLGNNLSNYLLTVCTASLIVEAFRVSDTRAEFVVAAVLAPLVFVFGDVLPKNWYQADTDRLMAHSTRFLHGTVLLFRYTGVLWMLQRLANAVVRITGHDHGEGLRSARAEVIGLLHEGAAHGGLTLEQTQFIERVMNLANVRVGAIMVPRRRAVTVPIRCDRRQFERIVRGSPHSRLPVIGPDHRSIVGIVSVQEVLACEAERPVEPCLQPPLTLTASTSAASALVQLRESESKMAVITDPRHGFVGLVTLKDVVEEIFGELPAW